MKTVFDVLSSKNKEAIASKELYLIAGKAKDYADYRYVCGQIRGLETAQSEISDLSRIYMEDNNDDD